MVVLVQAPVMPAKGNAWNGVCMTEKEQKKRRIRLCVAYDGTNYCGWQIQENAVTVEGMLTRALREWLKEEIEIIGASRTDSGVHAYGNIAVFDTNSRIPAEKFAIGLNHYLPEDIRVQKSDEVEADYHPRHRNTEKTYEYTILNTKINLPVYSRYSYHVYHALDVEAMEAAAQLIVGEHDFSAFCSAGSQVRSKVRTVYEVSLHRQEAMGCNGGEIIRIRVRGNGFLYNMVRIIAGTLVEVGEGRRTPKDVEQALSTGERKKAGPTAPPQGLVLVEIKEVPEI